MAAPRVARAQETIKWKGQTFCTRGNRFFEQAEDFAFMIEKYTNGRVKIDLHQAGEIVPAGQVFDAAGQGIIDFGMGCPCVLSQRPIRALSYVLRCSRNSKPHRKGHLVLQCRG